MDASHSHNPRPLSRSRPDDLGETELVRLIHEHGKGIRHVHTRSCAILCDWRFQCLAGRAHRATNLRMLRGCNTPFCRDAQKAMRHIQPSWAYRNNTALRGLRGRHPDSLTSVPLACLVSRALIAREAHDTEHRHPVSYAPEGRRADRAGYLHAVQRDRARVPGFFSCALHHSRTGC